MSHDVCPICKEAMWYQEDSRGTVNSWCRNCTVSAPSGITLFLHGVKRANLKRKKALERYDIIYDAAKKIYSYIENDMIHLVQICSATGYSFPEVFESLRAKKINFAWPKTGGEPFSKWSWMNRSKNENKTV